MQTVYVFVYRHDFGTDIGVYATRELALKNAAFIMLEWWEDLAYPAARVKASIKILEALKAQNYEEAFTLWNDAMGEDETMLIEEHLVSPPAEDVNISETLELLLQSIVDAEGARDHSEV